MGMSFGSKLAGFLGIRLAADTGTPEGVNPPSRTSSSGVTVDAAMSLSAVYRAVYIWAAAVSQLSLDVWRGTTPVTPTPALIRQPDLTIPLSAFLEQTVVSLATAGNAYWLLHRKDSVPSGEVRTMECLSPLLVNPLADSTGTRIAAYSYNGKTYTKSDIQHLQLLRVPGHLEGLGPIQAARLEIAGALDVRAYAAEWFQRGDVPPGVLSSDQPLNAQQAKDYKAAWYEDTKGIKVLGSGLKYVPLLLSPEDAQFIASQNLSVLQAARMFGIPARIMLATLEGSSDTYANVAQEDLSFVRWGMAKVTREIEEAFTAVIPRGQVARFNLDALLRADTLTRYQAHALALDPQKGWMTRDEVRAIEGLAPTGQTATPQEDSQ